MACELCLFFIEQRVSHDGPGAGGGDEVRIAAQVGIGDEIARWRFAVGLARFQFVVGQTHGQGAARNIDVDDIPFRDEAEGTTFGCFRRNVADAGACCAAGETSVGEEGNFLAETGRR